MFFSTNPEIKKDYLGTYFYAIQRNQTERFEDVVKTELNILKTKENPDSKELFILAKYGPYLGESEDVSVYASTLLEKYPDSIEAQKMLVEELSNTENVEDQVSKLSEFENKYPGSDLLSEAYDNVIFSLLQKNKFDELSEILKTNANPPSLYDFYYVVQGMIDNKYDNETALQIARIGQERSIREIEVEPSKKPKHLLTREWIEEQKYGALISFCSVTDLYSI